MIRETTYDFSETAAFFEEVFIVDLYDDVINAMHDLRSVRRLSRKDIIRIWGVLLTCADLLNTITLK